MPDDPDSSPDAQTEALLDVFRKMNGSIAEQRQRLDAVQALVIALIAHTGVDGDQMRATLDRLAPNTALVAQRLALDTLDSGIACRTPWTGPAVDDV